MTRRPSFRTTPGSHFSTVSSRDNRPSPTSCSMTAAVKVFVALPIRNLPFCGIGRAVPLRAAPARARSRECGDVTSAATPTTPVRWTASTYRRSGSTRPGIAAAGGPVDTTRRAAARPSPTDLSLPETPMLIPISLRGACLCRDHSARGRGRSVRGRRAATIPSPWGPSAHPAVPRPAEAPAPGRAGGCLPPGGRRTGPRTAGSPRGRVPGDRRATAGAPLSRHSTGTAVRIGYRPAHDDCHDQDGR